MTTTTLKVKNGFIKLPKELQQSWRNTEILARVSKNIVILKKMEPDSFWVTWKKLRSAWKGISGKDVDKAISWARTPQQENDL